MLHLIFYCVKKIKSNFLSRSSSVECRNPNVQNLNNAESRTNASLVIRRSDFGHSGRSKQPKLV